MSSSRPVPVALRFGAELEVLTGSRANSHMEWYLTANELSQELMSAQVKNHVTSDHNKDAEDYSEWSIIQEVTITNQMMQNKCKLRDCSIFVLLLYILQDSDEAIGGIELVSPILDFQDYSTWHWHMDAVWWVLSRSSRACPHTNVVRMSTSRRLKAAGPSNRSEKSPRQSFTMKDLSTQSCPRTAAKVFGLRVTATILYSSIRPWPHCSHG
jgi:hypothetical protein